MDSPCKLAAMWGIAILLLSNAWAVLGSNRSQLLTELFANYDNSVRPVCGQDQAVPVTIGMAVRQIIDLNEPKQILYLNAWLRLAWFDCQLQWDPLQYNNVSNMIFPYEKVWTPDITLYDNADGEMVGLKEYRVNVYSDGWVYYNFPTVIAVMCKIDVTYFPFDTQKCPLQYSSWAYHGFELDLTNRTLAGDITSLIPNSEFDITSIPLARHVGYYGCCPEPYPDVTFYIYMRRKPMFYVFNLLFPCVLITAVAVLGFLLPPDAGEKISLEITVLLSLAVFLLVVSETLPPTSETFPYIGTYFASAMVLVSLSTVLTVLVLNVHHKEYRPVPKWMKALFFRVFAKIVFFDDEPANQSHKVQVQQNDYHHHNGFPGHHDNGNILGHQINYDHFIKSDPGEEKIDLPQTNGTSRPPSALGEETTVAVDGSSQFSPLYQILLEQLRLMKKAEARKEGKMRHEAQCNEWRKVGIILDRLFLLLFVLTSMITSFAVLIPLANSDEAE